MQFRVSYRGRRAENYGLIDSGADQSAFPLEMMRELGISKRRASRHTFESAAGEGVQWESPEPMTMTVHGVRLRCRPMFCDTPVPLLGREDFFRRFRVIIDHRAQQFSIQPY